MKYLSPLWVFWHESKKRFPIFERIQEPKKFVEQSRLRDGTIIDTIFEHRGKPCVWGNEIPTPLKNENT